jgi:16S rRNA G1207 methylase RsmC
MLYTPSVEYDYIVMNPPFNVSPIPETAFKRTIEKQTKGKDEGKDIFDIDFIMKAYTHLKQGGQLVAIMRKDPIAQIQKKNISASSHSGKRIKAFEIFLKDKKWSFEDIPEKKWRGKELPKDLMIPVIMLKITK